LYKRNDLTLEYRYTVLQNEIRVKNLALSALQRIHDNLLIDYSHSKRKVDEYKKEEFEACRTISSLMEELVRLQAQIENLKQEVAQSRDELR
jgi:hypothetical protein